MFGKLGDMAGMMKQAQQMQKSMKKIQDELPSLEVSGKSSCGRVEIIATCDMVVKRAVIAPALLETTDVSVLEESVVEATNNAIDAAKTTAQSKMAEITGGLDLPGLG